jgi:hypothetical protein
MTRSESKEVRHRDYHQEVVSMTNPKENALLASALAVSLPTRPTELDAQQKAPPYGDDKPDGLVCGSIKTLQSNNGVCTTKITMQRIMSDDRKKNCHQYVKVSTLSTYITQQTGHFIAPDSVVGFNAP